MTEKEDPNIIQLAGISCKGPPGQHRAGALGYSGQQHRIWYDLRTPHVAHMVLQTGGHVLVPLANVLGMGLPRDGADNSTTADEGKLSDAYYDNLRARVAAGKKAKSTTPTEG